MEIVVIHRPSIRVPCTSGAPWAAIDEYLAPLAETTKPTLEVQVTSCPTFCSLEDLIVVDVGSILNNYHFFISY